MLMQNEWYWRFMLLALVSFLRGHTASPFRSEPPPTGHGDWGSFISQCSKDVVSEIDANQMPPKLFEPVLHGYRLGDCISFCKCFADRFPDTFAAQYMQGGCSPDNYTRIMDILKGKEEQGRFSDNYQCPDGSSLVVHLRLGDKVEKAYFQILKRLDNNPQSTYYRFLDGGWSDKLANKARSHIKGLPEIIGAARTTNSSTIHIVSGSHYPYAGKSGHMSYVYLQCLKRAFEAEGYDVKLRIGGNPDEDFFFMTCARAIVVSGGGFSRHAGNIVERRGGVQVGRVFNMDGPPPNAKRAHVRERRREKLAAMADRVDHRVNLQPSLQRQEQRAQERAEAEVRPDDERERRREQTRARAKRKELYRRPARKSAPTR